MNSFKYIEYTGDDSADVLVSLLMNLAHPELAASGHDGEDSDVTSTTEIQKPPSMGFQPNEEDE